MLQFLNILRRNYEALAFSVTPSCRYLWLCGTWLRPCGRTTKHLLFSPILHKISAMAVHITSICLARDGFSNLVMKYYIIMFGTVIFFFFVFLSSNFPILDH
jgi:hypothetical protein